MTQPSTPHILAILFDEDDAWGRSVRDIIRVEGCDANAKRRLRRLVLKAHGYSSKWDNYSVTYEYHHANAGPDHQEDVTHRYRKPGSVA